MIEAIGFDVGRDRIGGALQFAFNPSVSKRVVDGAGIASTSWRRVPAVSPRSSKCGECPFEHRRVRLPLAIKWKVQVLKCIWYIDKQSYTLDIDLCICTHSQYLYKVCVLFLERQGEDFVVWGVSGRNQSRPRPRIQEAPRTPGGLQENYKHRFSLQT